MNIRIPETTWIDTGSKQFHYLTKCTIIIFGLFGSGGFNPGLIIVNEKRNHQNNAQSKKKNHQNNLQSIIQTRELKT